MSPGDTCKSCRFYVGPTLPAYEENDGDKPGQCRRYPPSWVSLPTNVYRSYVAHPDVWRDHCCGEYKPKP